MFPLAGQLSPLGGSRRLLAPNLPASPVALYLMNEGTGTTVNDSSGISTISFGTLTITADVTRATE